MRGSGAVGMLLVRGARNRRRRKAAAVRRAGGGGASPVVAVWQRRCSYMLL